MLLENEPDTIYENEAAVCRSPGRRTLLRMQDMIMLPRSDTGKSINQGRSLLVKQKPRSSTVN